MIRRTPAGKQAARFLPIVAGLVALGFVTEACTRDEPTEVTNPSDGDLHAVSGSYTVSCTAPCVEVEVLDADTDYPPEDGYGNVVPLVVTLLNGGTGGTGIVGLAPIDANGIARFTGVAPGGYCAYVTAITDVDIQDGSTADGTIPEADLVTTSAIQSAPFIGAVSVSATDSEPLSKANYKTYCLDWTGAIYAPFEVTMSTALLVELEVSEAEQSLEVSCRYFDGGTKTSAGEEICPTWAVIDLSDLSLPNWFETNRPTGTKQGLLVGAANPNVAEIFVLADEDLQLESAVGGANREEATFSFTNQSVDEEDTESLTADLEPLLCQLNLRPDEEPGDAACGIDFQFIKDGYLGEGALEGAEFEAGDQVAIWYDYEVVGGGHQRVRFHGRLRKASNGKGRKTKNIQLEYDFAPCSSGGQPVELLAAGPGASALESVQCRADTDVVRVTWIFNVPSDYRLQYRLRSACDVYPPPPRNKTSQSMQEVSFPDDGACPLDESNVAGSNDPKWWIAPS